MLREADRAAIERLWQRKLEQDAKGLARSERHRNLEPASAEFICALAAHWLLRQDQPKPRESALPAPEMIGGVFLTPLRAWGVAPASCRL
jgi:hypothetical protein